MKSVALRAGTLNEAHAPTGLWVFVDLGFATASKSCGYLEAAAGNWDESHGECCTFGDVAGRLSRLLADVGPPLHLVLEAPLSGAFDGKGNPPRSSPKRTTTSAAR